MLRITVIDTYYYDNRPNIIASRHKTINSNNNKLFRINAGYHKPLHLNKLFYYVIAPNKRKAKTIYTTYMTWMTVYSVAEVIDRDEVNNVLDNINSMIF